jgi:hypothetical protein
MAGHVQALDPWIEPGHDSLSAQQAAAMAFVRCFSRNYQGLERARAFVNLPKRRFR